MAIRDPLTTQEIALPKAFTQNTPLTADQRNMLADTAVQQLSHGIAQHRQGQIASALTTFQQALQSFRQLSQTTSETKVLIAIAQVYYGQAEYLWAADYARQAYTAAQRIAHTSLAYRALNCLGNSYRHLGDLSKAETCITRSLELVQDSESKICALSNLALVYRAQGNHQDAATFYEKSLLLAEAQDDIIVMQQLLRNLGNAYHALNQLEKAIAYYDRLLQLARQHMDPQMINRILRNLIRVCHTLEDYGLAVVYLQERLHLVRRLQDLRGEAQTLENLAIAYEVLGDTGQALQAREDHLKVAFALKDSKLQCQALSKLKMACVAEGDFERVRPYLDCLVACG